MALRALIFVVAAGWFAAPAVAQIPFAAPRPPSFFSRLVHEETIASEPLEPVKTVFENRGKEPLIVWIYDLRTDGRGSEHRLQPGQAFEFVAERDAGGILRQVYHTPRFGRLYEQVIDTPVPPATLYRVAVSANRVTYSYRDPKGISGAPAFDKSSLIPIGVFDIPPGDAIESGTIFDAVREAAARRNPGLIATLEPPQPLLKGAIIEREVEPAGPVAPPGPREF